MSEVVAPASVADPHRSLNRSVKGIFDNLTRTVNAYDGEGDIIEVASAALAGAAEELATLLNTRATDEAAYVARMQTEAAVVADAQDNHEPSPQAVALTETAKRAEDLTAAPDADA